MADGRWNAWTLWLASPLLVGLLLAALPLIALGLIVYPLHLLLEEVSGEGRWYRSQKRWMQEERPALSDEDFLSGECVPEIDAPVWIAVRVIMAEITGLRPESIDPGDSLVDIWRIQGLPDLLDLVFRLERELGVNISRRAIASLPPTAYGRAAGAFRDLAAAFADALRPLLPAQRSGKD